MKYTLKSFSQDIHLDSPDESQHFLVFNREDGTEFRIPVPQETIIALTKNTLAYEAKNPPVKELDDEEVQQAVEEVEQEFQEEAEDAAQDFYDDDGDATIFPPGDNLDDVEPVAKAPAKKHRTSIASEEDIPSL